MNFTSYKYPLAWVDPNFFLLRQVTRTKILLSRWTMQLIALSASPSQANKWTHIQACYRTHQATPECLPGQRPRTMGSPRWPRPQPARESLQRRRSCSWEWPGQGPQSSSCCFCISRVPAPHCTATTTVPSAQMFMQHITHLLQNGKFQWHTISQTIPQ